MCIRDRPYTARYEGLATALFTLLNTENIRAYITFQRGSEARIQTLMDGSANYCVMSRLTYNEYVNRGFPVSAVLDCGPFSYVGRHVLFARDPNRTDWSGARVGIDTSSVDQSQLTYRYFAPYDVEYIPVQYMHILDMLHTGQLDAGIWNEDDVHMSSIKVAKRPLENNVAQDGNTYAIIVTRSADTFTSQLIRMLVTPEAICTIQHKVMNNELPARY